MSSSAAPPVMANYEALHGRPDRAMTNFLPLGHRSMESGQGEGFEPTLRRMTQVMNHAMNHASIPAPLPPPQRAQQDARTVRSPPRSRGSLRRSSRTSPRSGRSRPSHHRGQRDFLPRTNVPFAVNWTSCVFVLGLPNVSSAGEIESALYSTCHLPPNCINDITFALSSQGCACAVVRLNNQFVKRVIVQTGVSKG